MDRIRSFGWGFTNERVLDTWAIPTESLIWLLSPEMAVATFAFFTDETVIFEERNGELFFINLHLTNLFSVT
jgi:hypothetical protein